MIIKSGENALYKYISSLRLKKGRDKAGAFIAEGIKMTGEALAHCETELIAVSEEYASGSGSHLTHGGKTAIFSNHLFSKLSDTKHTQGIMAICKKSAPQGPSNINPSGLYLILEDISDPGNLGTIIRAADAAGADGTFLSGGCADLYNPKTLRASAGSVFHIPCKEGVDLCLLTKAMNIAGVPLYAAHLKGAMYPYSLDLSKGCAFIIGNEARGISNTLATLADGYVKLPILGKAESLNAAAAAAILLYEAVRQRVII